MKSRSGTASEAVTGKVDLIRRSALSSAQCVADSMRFHDRLMGTGVIHKPASVMDGEGGR